MLSGATEIDDRNEAEAPAKGKARLLTLSDIDRRTRAYQQTAALIADLTSDLGGDDNVTTGERQLVQRAAVLGALLEHQETQWLAGDEIDPTAYCTIINAQRRVLETVGIKRRARNVTPRLKDYIAARATQTHATDAPIGSERASA